MTLVKISGKPIEKLIETVSAAIGTLYKPRAIRKEADAEAYRIERIEEAQAKGLLIKADAEMQIVERARQRFVHQEVNRQINLDNVVEKSTKYLPETVSEKPVDEDWRTRFFNKAQDVTSDEMQEIWGKILANEIASPNTVSLRTLDIVSNLSKTEAEVFQRVASLSFATGCILKYNSENAFEEFNVKYSDLLTLRAAGLLYESDTLNITYQSIDSIGGCFITFGNKLFRVFKDGFTKYVFSQVKFTPAGVELIRTLKFESNYQYLEKFITEKSKEGFHFQKIPSSKN